jgi:hypothetical protein
MRACRASLHRHCENKRVRCSVVQKESAGTEAWLAQHLRALDPSVCTSSQRSSKLLQQPLTSAQTDPPARSTLVPSTNVPLRENIVLKKILRHGGLS